MASTSKQKDVEDIILLRGKTGLGFNIRGGTDIQHIKTNNGIFVTKIRDKGAAAEDGRLKEGDQIIEINNNKVLTVTHTAAVNYFLTSGEKVLLKVIPGEEQRIKTRIAMEQMKARMRHKALRSIANDDGSSSMLYKMSLVLVGLGVVASVAFIGYRYVKQRS